MQNRTAEELRKLYLFADGRVGRRGCQAEEHKNSNCLTEEEKDPDGQEGCRSDKIWLSVWCLLTFPDRGALHLQQGASWPQSPEKADPVEKKFSTVSLCLAVGSSSFYGIIYFFFFFNFLCVSNQRRLAFGRLRNALVDDLLIENLVR